MKINQTLDNLPNELLTQRRFFPLVDGGDTLKACKAPAVKWQDPANLALPNEGANVGRTLGFSIVGRDGGDDYLVFDFDNVLDDSGEFVTEKAAGTFTEMIAALGDTFVERSASGHGLHVIAKPTAGKFEGNMAGAGKHCIDLTDDGLSVNGKSPKLEVYYRTGGKYFIFTGDLFNCVPKNPIATGAAVDDYLTAHLAKVNATEAAKKAERTASSNQPTATPQPNNVPPSTDYEIARAEKMLEFIDPTPYADWIAVGAALKQMGEPVWVWDSWSKRSAKYTENKPGAIEKHWESFTPKYSEPIACLHELAKKGGYSEREFQKEWHAKERQERKQQEIARKEEYKRQVEAKTIRQVQEMSMTQAEKGQGIVTRQAVELPKPDKFSFLQADWKQSVDVFSANIQTEMYKLLPTGIMAFDKLIGGGFLPTDVVLLGGQPNCGKTAVLQWLAEGMVTNTPDLSCIFLNFELSRDELIARSIRQRVDAAYDWYEILQGFAWADETRCNLNEAIAAYRQEIAGRLIYNPAENEAMPKRDINEVKQLMKYAAEMMIERGQRAPLFVLDYVQLLKDDNEDTKKTIANAMEMMCQYAKKYKTPVIAAMANGRKANEGGVGSLFGGRDSSNLEYGATTMLQLCARTGKDGLPIDGKRWVKTVKGKGFAPGMAMLYDFSTGVVRNAEYGKPPKDDDEETDKDKELRQTFCEPTNHTGTKQTVIPLRQRISRKELEAMAK